MKTGIWISYDLSVTGDYEGLYTWLDDFGAKECGDSLAYLLWTDTGNGDIPDQIKQSISSYFKYDKKKDRIYLVYREKTNKDKISIKGKFIFGSRKASPWEGLAPKAEEDDEYEE
jgi:hypothetical protein